MSEVLNTLGSAATGGLFGIVGVALGRVAGYFERKQTFQQEEKRWSHDVEMQKLGMDADAQKAKIALEMAAQKGSWDGLKASIQADANIGAASLWVINILRLVRPVLTLMLWLITAWIFSKTQDASIANSAVFAATASTLWWFGDRAPKPDLGAARRF